MKSPSPILAAIVITAGIVAPVKHAVALDVVPSLQNISPLIPELQARLRAGVHDDYERVVFDWPKQIPYTLEQNGQNVTLRFQASSTLDLSVIPRRHLSRVLHFESLADAKGSEVKFILAPNVVAKPIQQGNLVIVDFYAGKAPVLAEQVPMISNAPQAMLIASEAPAAPLAPIAEQAAPEKHEEGFAKKPEAPVIGDTQEKPAVETQAAHEVEVKEAEKKIENAIPTPTNEAPDLGEVGEQAIPLVTLDTGVPIGAAIYRRADYVYIVFAKKITLPLASLLRDTPRVKVESLQSSTGTVFRFYMPQDLDLRSGREESRWTILAAKKSTSAPLSLTFSAQPDYALGPRMVIPLNNAEEPVRFNDPQMGDSLVIVPLPASGQAIRNTHRFADFRLLPSEQGVVIQPLVDGVNIKRQSAGVEITSDNGLRLSPSKDTGLTSDTNAGALGKDQLFNLNEWYGPANKSYTEMRQHWQETLAEVSPADRDRVRLNTARFYFARNHAQECLGLLANVARQVPDLLHRPEFLALRGAARVLAHDAQAMEDLSSPELNKYAEIKLWMAVAKTQSLEWKEASELFAQSDNVLQKYPEPFFTNFSILAIETGLASRSKVYAAKILERLIERHPELDASSGPVNYLRGVLLSVTEQLDRAEQYWTKAAASKDRLYAVRAKLSLTDYEVITQKITPLQAAQKLERLRFAWRGDDLELDILRRIGKFYIEAGKMEDGLATLKQALVLLPENDAAKALHEEMTFAFRDVFLGNKGKTIPPLEALSLYERFYDLAPMGPEGDAIIRSLAQHMVSLDLLDRAGMLLSDQARRRLSGALKTKVGTQAAGIYVLDRKPQEALDILKDTQDASADEELRSERDLLKAKALSLLGRDGEAKDAMKNVNDENALRLSIDIAWHSRDWAGAAAKLETLIGPPPEDSIGSEAAQWVINRAIALALINDKAGLDGLRAKFAKTMKATPQAELFKTLVEPDNGLPRDPAAMKSLMADVDLFQSYLENYRNLK